MPHRANNHHTAGVEAARGSPPAALTASRQIPVRPAWLALGREDPLGPAQPVVDPHHHLWDRADERYLAPDLLDDVREAGRDVRPTVFVQCGTAYRAGGPEDERSLGETAWASAVAAAHPAPPSLCAGVVGFVDLTLGDRVTPLLEAHIAAAHGRFRGVRNRTAWHPDPTVRSNLLGPPPGPLEDPRFAEGARRLAAHGLPLDVWAYQTQLPRVAALARAVPGLVVVVDHCGGPLGVGPFAGRPPEGFAAWRREVLALAALPNVRMKLGGLAMEVAGFGFHLRAAPPNSEELAAAWRPHVETCVEAFGPGRCMFESNFPVDKGMVGYGALWNAFVRLAAGASDDERRALFAGTAVRTYGLDPSLAEPVGPGGGASKP